MNAKWDASLEKGSFVCSLRLFFLNKHTNRQPPFPLYILFHHLLSFSLASFNLIHFIIEYLKRLNSFEHSRAVMRENRGYTNKKATGISRAWVVLWYTDKGSGIFKFWNSLSQTDYNLINFIMNFPLLTGH